MNIPPYGKVLIDSDGETLMSLGVLFNPEYLQTLRLKWIDEDPMMIELRPVVLGLVDDGHRYVIQDEP